MAKSYYNENNFFAVQYLRSMIKSGKIAPGHVDTRSITDVRASDLRGYSQCHFFAGIGGWSLALRKAGWPDDCQVWTGSCPCQPWSEVGKRKGQEDARHLWPELLRLIQKRKPPVLFGEQVPEAIPQGWFDEVSCDLEAEGYAIGAAVLSACVIEAPQERERLWFVACADGKSMVRPPVSRYKRHTWPSEPKLARVVDGVPNQRDFAHALGNAIIPRAGAEFVSHFMAYANG